MALKLTARVRMGDESVTVPTVEAALALKFYSMINRGRPLDDRMQDAVDFSRAAKAQEKVDLDLLHQLGELVYGGGGDEILKFVSDARAGRRLDV